MKPLLILTAATAWPLFVWQIFRSTQGLLGQITGAVNNTSRGFFDRNRKSRANMASQARKDATGSNRFRGGRSTVRDASGNVISRGNLRGRMNERIGRAANIGAAGYSLDRDTRRARISDAVSRKTSSEAQELMESEEMKSLAGNETLLQSGSYVGTDGQQGTDASIREFLINEGQTGQELEQNVATVRKAVRAKSQRAYNAISSVMVAGTGTGYLGGQGEMDAAINAAAGDDRALAGRLLNMARGQAERANRPDLYGSGFGESLNALNAQYQAGDSAAAQAATTQAMDLGSLNAKGISLIVNSRNNQLSRLAPLLAAQHADAIGRGDVDAATEISAQIAAARNSINAGTSAENRQVVNNLLNAVGVDLQGAGSTDEQLAARIVARVAPPPPVPRIERVVDDRFTDGRMIDRLTPQWQAYEAQISSVTEEIRNRAGLYDQGSRAMDPTIRAGAGGPGTTAPPP